MRQLGWAVWVAPAGSCLFLWLGWGVKDCFSVLGWFLQPVVVMGSKAAKGKLLV